MADETLIQPTQVRDPEMFDLWARDGVSRYVDDFDDGWIICRCSRGTSRQRFPRWEWNAWASKATLLVRDGKPYQPPAPSQAGDVITVPCAVLLRPDGTVMVDGSDDATGDETAGSWPAGYKHIATVPVIVPQLLKEVPSLPPVTATPASPHRK